MVRQKQLPPNFAFYGQVPPHHSSEVPTDRKSQPGAAEFSRYRHISLHERFENLSLLVFGIPIPVSKTSTERMALESRQDLGDNFHTTLQCKFLALARIFIRICRKREPSNSTCFGTAPIQLYSKSSFLSRNGTRISDTTLTRFDEVIRFGFRVLVDAIRSWIGQECH